jgi:hypothetical protein
VAMVMGTMQTVGCLGGYPHQWERRFRSELSYA